MLATVADSTVGAGISVTKSGFEPKSVTFKFNSWIEANKVSLTDICVVALFSTINDKSDIFLFVACIPKTMYPRVLTGLIIFPL